VQGVTVSRLFDLSVPGCPVCVCAGVLAADTRGRVRVVSGHGSSPAQAMARCLAEAAERSLAVWEEERPVTKAALSAMPAPAVDPRQLVLLSEDQYARRETWNAAVPADHHWPAPFDVERPLDWVEALPLAGGETVLVPAASCFLGFPAALEQGFAVPDSSGLAAGASVMDAAGRALLELVERDAVAVWWYNRLKRPPFDFERENIPWISDLEDHFGAAGRRVWTLDLTHDLAVPVAAAVSSDMGGRDLALGFGAGWTAQEAAAAALGELVQFEASKRLQTAGGPLDLVTLARTGSLEDFPFLVPDADAPVQPPGPGSTEELVEALAEQGLAAFAIDLSRGSWSVMRVIVPGLRPLWPRFAPGRLFDVPRRIGWTAGPTAEASFNPVPILY
jgi:YcaO-like protein with predicted kinase domain